MDDNINKSDDINIDPLENDQLAQELSDTFEEPFDETSDNSTFSNDDWDEEIESDFYEGENVTTSHSPKSQINWFNIGVFGFVGIAAIVLGYDQFIGSAPTPVSVIQQKPASQAPSLQEKQDLAQQAISGTLNTPTSPQGFLGNPDILADANNEEQVTKQHNADNDLFNVLDTPPSYEDDLEDMLSTLKQPAAPKKNDIEKIETIETIDTLPLPSDAHTKIKQTPTTSVSNNTDISPSLPVMQTIETVAVKDDTSDIAINASTSSIEETTESSPTTATTSADIIKISSQVETLSTRLNDLTSRMDTIMDKMDAETHYGCTSAST